MKKRVEISIPIIAVSLVISYLIYFFMGFKFNIPIFEKIIIVFGWFILFMFFAGRSKAELFLFGLTSITTFVGLTTAFNSSIIPNGLIILPIKLGLWLTLLLTLIFSLSLMWAYNVMKKQDKYSIILFISFLVYWVLIAINTKYVDGWVAENILVILFLIILYFAHRWFKFSKISYSLIFVFLVLHVMGSHYTYSEVPLGYWMSQLFNLERNHFDRLVHFSFGILWTYPLREMFKRIADVKGFWSYWIPVELILAMSCVFELIEWGVAVIFGGDLGVAYLGTQGDVWDAQKDMALAGLGSIITTFFVMGVTMYYNKRSFLIELKNSFKVKSKKVMGEVSLLKLMKKRQ